jgi:hypothetical protein
MVLCHDAMAISVVAKVRGKVFTTFVNNPLDVKENYEHALDFGLVSLDFSIGRIVGLSLWLILSSLNACVIISTHCWIHCDITSQLQIKGNKKLDMLVLIIYQCITLLQLLYRWQHQSRKLWIPVCLVCCQVDMFSPVGLTVDTMVK